MFVVFLVFFLGALVRENHCNTCPDRETWVATLHKTNISGPIERGRHLLIRGRNTLLSMQFTPKIDIEGDIKVEVKGVFADSLEIPYGVPETNACQNCNLACPLKANEMVDYHAVLPVESYYPPVSLNVRWELMSASGQMIVCFDEKVKLVSADKVKNLE